MSKIVDLITKAHKEQVFVPSKQKHFCHGWIGVYSVHNLYVFDIVNHNSILIHLTNCNCNFYFVQMELAACNENTQNSYSIFYAV